MGSTPLLSALSFHALPTLKDHPMLEKKFFRLKRTINLSNMRFVKGTKCVVGFDKDGGTMTGLYSNSERKWYAVRGDLQQQRPKDCESVDYLTGVEYQCCNIWIPVPYTKG